MKMTSWSSRSRRPDFPDISPHQPWTLTIEPTEELYSALQALVDNQVDLDEHPLDCGEAVAMMDFLDDERRWEHGNGVGRPARDSG